MLCNQRTSIPPHGVVSLKHEMKETTSAEKAEKFITEATQFRLGKLITESPHPVTQELSKTAAKSISDALELLFEADRDVIEKYREWISTNAPARIAQEVLTSLLAGGKIFFTGCGSTGRLSILMDSTWRDYWQKLRAQGFNNTEDWENRTRSVMAGGDFALIKAVEGFEDFTQFGGKQIEDQGISAGDIVFAITEGGETSFVIGTAWKGLEKGAKVYFVYNNPDEILRERVTRSREVIDDPRIEKINLTTGPMSITGSTRMQATSIQLCALLTIFEIVIRGQGLGVGGRGTEGEGSGDSNLVPREFMSALEQAHAILSSETVRKQLADLVALEESVYRRGHKNTYFADQLAVDVLTDTTERSPTYCVPAFRKFNDTEAAESWSFLFLPCEETATAWERLLKRPLNPVSWNREEIAALVGEENSEQQLEIVQRIGKDEILKFKIGMDGLPYRQTSKGDSVICIVTDEEIDQLINSGGRYRKQLENAKAVDASTGLIFIGKSSIAEEVRSFVADSDLLSVSVIVPLPETNQFLDGIKRISAKLLLNALSTCTMVRLGRVLGNFMIWVVPSNLKLIDRSARYISHLTDLSYEDSCRLLFEVIEHIEPRMKAGKEYPPPVGMAVIRARQNCSNEEAEALLKSGEVQP